MEIYSVLDTELDWLRRDLSGRGVHVYELDGSSVSDDISFYTAALSALPMGDASKCPEVDWCQPANWNWNAFIDFLWQGLTEESADPTALIWLEVDRVVVENRQTLRDALHCIGFVADNPGHDKSRPLGKPAEVYLVGHVRLPEFNPPPALVSQQA